jgi:hypothetical protein
MEKLSLLISTKLGIPIFLDQIDEVKTQLTERMNPI